METEHVDEANEKSDGDLKTCYNMPNNDGQDIENKESLSELAVKQNGMSEYSEPKQETTEIHSDLKLDTKDESVFLNSANGQTADDSEQIDCAMKSTETKEILDPPKVEDRAVNLSDSLFKHAEEADNNKEIENFKSYDIEASEKNENVGDVDEESLNEAQKNESMDAAKQLGFESEDSSKDSTDSSISNISKSSDFERKEGNWDLQHNADKEQDGSDKASVVDSVTEQNAKLEQEAAENDSSADSGNTENMEHNEEKNDASDSSNDGEKQFSDENKSTDNKDNASDNLVKQKSDESVNEEDSSTTEKMEVTGEKNVASDSSTEKEKDLPGENNSNSAETKDIEDQTSDTVDEANAKHQIIQQPTVPLMVPVSSVPYVMPQQQLKVHQQQTGYITKVGNQHIFVPVSNASPSIYPVVSMQTASLTGSQVLAQASLKPAGDVLTEKPVELAPKSSLEMIELMKWEIQNRIPDNYNWSVAFHPKKDDLSSVTAFLLELGHDVVKEAVYKDIILIQTKKKDQGKLKASEIESLEKMKTVYENTKKKVEHLEMKMFHCKQCKFQTESEVIMKHHKDHPHMEPPWDWHSGYLCCAHCDFKTKQTAAFSFHMEAVHNAVAKMPDKPGQFPCEMCPLDLSTKNKLEKHRVKCMKSFKLNVNLQPYYHDVNFCMKTCYYKPKKAVAKPPPKKIEPRLQPQRNQPIRSTSQIVRTVNAQQVMGIRQTMMQPQFVARAPPPLQRQPISLRPIIRAPEVPYRQVPPQIKKPPVVRQMIQQQKQSSAPGTPPVRPPSKEMSGFEVCELCGGYVKDRQALRIHFYYAHKVEMPQTIFNRPSPPLSCDVCQSKFWTTQGLSKHKSNMRHYASSNAGRGSTPTHKCFMCSRMVPNLFVHVEQSHGMTMKELVAMKKCIMCGMTAPDIKQLEVHMSTMHGVLIKASDFLGPQKVSLPNKNPVNIQPKAGTPVTTSTPNKGKSMVRNNLCVFCQIQFADNIQLTMHCIKIHATCSACGMVVASSKHLQSHHCKKMMRDCVICGLKKLAPDAYAQHIKKHVKPCSVTVDKMSEKNVISTKENIKKNYKPAVISLDSDSGGESDVELVADDDQKSECNSEAGSGKDKENTELNDSKSERKKSSKAEVSVKAGGGKFKSSKRKLEISKIEKLEEKDTMPDQDIRESADNTDHELASESDNFLNHNDKSELEKEIESKGTDKKELDQREIRKRKAGSSDESDFEEQKRPRTETDFDDNITAEKDDGDDNSKGDKNMSDKDIDNMHSIKRPIEEVEMNESGADSGTESDQACKRKKITEENV